MKIGARGFTLIELLVVITIIGILAAIALPNYMAAKDKAKEVEVKSNLHIIQVALERYVTDNNEYPHYLLGGDIAGWLNWHSKWDGINDVGMPGGRLASNSRVQDPLVEYDYVTSFPKNPFVGDGQIIIRQTDVDGGDEQGDGDPRFGFRGNIMGQGLDDNNFFSGAVQPGPYFWSEIETRRTLDRGDWMNVPAAFISGDPFNTNMYYLFGGFRFPPESVGSGDPGKLISTYWPGQFFYKASSDQMLTRHGFTTPVPNTNIGGHFNRYMLGAYGSGRTNGMDIIRLIWWNPDGERLYWRSPPPFPEASFYLGYEYFDDGFDEPGGLPEVFGGGDEWHGPCWPYNKSEEHMDQFIYGAPDGVEDGIILVLTNGSEVMAYFQ
jgi:prepilin-type N-terminal cleavage/methylation domain-containing protein